MRHILKKRQTHLEKRGTLVKVHHTWKKVAHLEKCFTLINTLKNEQHLKKSGTYNKMRHTWKSAAHLKKCATFGKMGHKRKNAPH